MKRIAFSLALSLCLLIVISQHTPVAAKDTWVSVRTKNFLMLGNASEKDIRRVALKLEQFREAFTIIFPSVRFNTPVPTTVVVFKSDSSYAPFKPNANTAGYFQSGPGRELHHAHDRSPGRAGSIHGHLSRVHTPARQQHLQRRAGLVQRRTRGVLQHFQHHRRSASCTWQPDRQSRLSVARKQNAAVEDALCGRSKIAVLQRAQQAVDLLRAVVGVDALPDRRQRRTREEVRKIFATAGSECAGGTGVSTGFRRSL